MSKKLNRKVPKLRFPEFKGDWDLKKLRSISSLSSGATPLRSNSSYFENATIPWVKTTDLNNSEILKTEECISDIAIRETSARKNPVGSVLIAMYGGFNQIGRTGLLKIEAATNQAITVVLPKSGIDSYFLLHFLNRNVDQWRSFAASSRKDPNITSKDVGDFPIAFPPIAEQEKIASFLGAVDTRITQLRRKHELLQTYKRGIMQKLFSQQIRFKGDRGKPFPKWEKKDFGDIVSKVSSKYDPCSDEVSYPCIELESIASNEGRLIKVFNSKDQQSIKNKFKSKDVLFGKLRPYLRKFIFADFDGVCSTEIWVLRGKRISSSYLYYLVQGGKFNRVSNITFGSKMPRSDWDFISTFPFEFPGKEEQEKIVDFLTAIDQKIEAVTKQIKLTEQFKKGLLQKMFV